MSIKNIMGAALLAGLGSRVAISRRQLDSTKQQLQRGDGRARFAQDAARRDQAQLAAAQQQMDQMSRPRPRRRRRRGPAATPPKEHHASKWAERRSRLPPPK